jgi:hypothetical protein
MFDISHKANPNEYKKKEVTITHIPEYEQFANGESIQDLRESVR